MNKIHPSILLADNHVLVVDKPPGMLVQSTQHCSESLEEWAREWVRRDKDKHGNVYLHALHRLDRPVGGVVLFARTSKALSRLNAAMRSRQIHKTYRALVTPAPERDTDELHHWLCHSSRHAIVSDAPSENAKSAILSYRTISRQANAALLEVELETGRYHQIRAQLAHIGCPIIGDEKYGGPPVSGMQDLPPGVIALHHCRLEFPHPVSSTAVVVESRPPGFWAQFPCGHA